jgi:DNA-binding transcriptional LysR family regulator
VGVAVWRLNSLTAPPSLGDVRPTKKARIVRTVTTNSVEWMDRLTSMSIFVRVVALGGFAAAAREADISATMAAKHVQALEARLGARLLHRTTRRQSLTEIGRIYYDRCKSLLAEVDAAESSVSRLRVTPRGTLRVTAPVTFGTRRLVPALAEFLRLHPDVNVDLTLNDRVADLIDEGFEAAIRVGHLPDSRLIARPLQPYRSMLCASPDYIRQRGRPKMPQDLRAHNCLGFSFAGVLGRWRLSRNGEEQTVTFTPRLRANNGEGLRQAALAGVGIVLQPEVLLADDVREKRLVPVLPTWRPPPRPLHLLYARDRQATPKLQCFIDFIAERFKADRDSS